MESSKDGNKGVVRVFLDGGKGKSHVYQIEVPKNQIGEFLSMRYTARPGTQRFAPALTSVEFLPAPKRIASARGRPADGDTRAQVPTQDWQNAQVRGASPLL